MTGRAAAFEKDECIGEPYPAWTAIGVGASLEPRAIVEIRVIARRPSDSWTVFALDLRPLGSLVPDRSRPLRLSLLHLEGHRLAAAGIDVELAVDGRDGSLWAILAPADAAGEADPVEGLGPIDDPIVGMDRIAGKADRTAEPDGVAPHRRAKARSARDDGAGQADLALAVRRLRQLPHALLRAFEGLVHHPERAGATEAG